MSNTGALVGLFPHLGAIGGVERACGHAAVVMADLASKLGRQTRFLSLNDDVGTHSLTVAGQTFKYEGFGRAKLAFAMAATRGPTSLAVLGHPHLSPVGWALQQRTGARVATICWGIDVWTRLSLLPRWSLQRADAVLPISRFTAEETVRLQGVDKAKLRLLPLALDPLFWERAQQAAAVPPPAGFPRGRVILSVARLARAEGYKGVDTIISALPGLVQEFPDLQYLVVGDGDDRPRLEQLARSLGVTAHVHFGGKLGSQSAELIGSFAHADVFALPSHGEGFGIVFLEAMAFGKPVIGGAHGGTLDVIEEGVSGRLVAHGDVAALTAALRPLLADPAGRRELGESGRRRVEQNFLFEHFHARLTAILNELVAPASPSSTPRR